MTVREIGNQCIVWWERNGEATGECLIEDMRRKGTRPGQVWVVAADLAEALNPLAVTLGIAPQVVGKLPQIQAAKLPLEQAR